MEEFNKRYYRGLYEIAVEVNLARNPESVLNTLVEKMAEVLEVKACSVMLLTGEGKLLRHAAAYGLSDSYVHKGPVSTDRSIAEALEGKATVILDAASDERVQYREEARQEGIASILAAPMKYQEETLGVIRVYTAKQRRFTEDDIYFVQVAAHLGAIALRNAELLQAAMKTNESLSRELEEWRKTMGVSPPRLSGRR